MKPSDDMDNALRAHYRRQRDEVQPPDFDSLLAAGAEKAWPLPWVRQPGLFAAAVAALLLVGFLVLQQEPAPKEHAASIEAYEVAVQLSQWRAPTDVLLKPLNVYPTP